MKFLVCKKMQGEGCDYTIGCGMRFDFLEAESVEDAVQQVIYPDGPNETSSLEGEQPLSDILIINAQNVYVVEIEQLRKIIKHKRHEEKIAKESAELMEYQRLKRKFGIGE